MSLSGKLNQVYADQQVLRQMLEQLLLMQLALDVE